MNLNEEVKKKTYKVIDLNDHALYNQEDMENFLDDVLYPSLLDESVDYILMDLDACDYLLPAFYDVVFGGLGKKPDAIRLWYRLSLRAIKHPHRFGRADDFFRRGLEEAKSEDKEKDGVVLVEALDTYFDEDEEKNQRRLVSFLSAAIILVVLSYVLTTLVFFLQLPIVG